MRTWDDKLLLEFNKGSQRAFSSIFDLYYGQIFYFARRLIADEEAADITADTFHKLFKLYANFETRENIRAFLYITTRNACFNYLKSKKTKDSNLKEFTYHAEAQSEDDFSGYELKLDDELKVEFLRQVYEIIELLPKRRRAVFKLIYIDGLSAQEIANKLGISIYSVHNHKFQALKDLKNLVNERGLKLLPVLVILAYKYSVQAHA